MNTLINCLGITMTSLCFSQSSFTLKSTDIGGQLSENQEFNNFGCTGKNLSPQLQWANAPKEAKSFAITMYDPDAPTGSGWWHWLVFNIPPNITSVETGAGNILSNKMPTGVIQSKTDFNTAGYGGPCPPEDNEIHSYIITVYALRTNKLELTSETNPALVGSSILRNTIEKASLMVYYKR